MTPKLSILIPTLYSRIFEFSSMVSRLHHQAKGLPVEILWLGETTKTIILGKKRNLLMSMASGTHLVFCDDDDSVSLNYVGAILTALDTDPDVVCFGVECRVDGGEWKRVRYDLNYERDGNFPTHYERLPNHIMCTRRTLAMQAGFPEVSFAEDFDFARRLKPLLKTQVLIDDVLYHYDYSSTKSETPR
jgi:hypothetical protein